MAVDEKKKWIRPEIVNSISKYNIISYFVSP